MDRYLASREAAFASELVMFANDADGAEYRAFYLERAAYHWRFCFAYLQDSIERLLDE